MLTKFTHMQAAVIQSTVSGTIFWMASVFLGFFGGACMQTFYGKSVCNISSICRDIRLQAAAAKLRIIIGNVLAQNRCSAVQWARAAHYETAGRWKEMSFAAHWLPFSHQQILRLQADMSESGPNSGQNLRLLSQFSFQRRHREKRNTQTKTSFPQLRCSHH